jgi:hypothetical protein
MWMATASSIWSRHRCQRRGGRCGCRRHRPAQEDHPAAQASEPDEPAPIPLPPFNRSAALLPPQERLPVDIVDASDIPANLLALQDQVFTAQDIADVNAFLAQLDQDEQDAEDIADLLASLD